MLAAKAFFVYAGYVNYALESALADVVMMFYYCGQA